MNTDESNIEDEFLPDDLEEAYTLSFWKNYCIAQTNHWTLEHQRAVNDLKYLRFKKLDSERKMKIEKRN